MMPFDLNKVSDLPEQFQLITKQLLNGIKHNGGMAFLTVHGKKLLASQTLRRGGPHTDGNYEPMAMTFGSGGGSGWKIGENGPAINTAFHDRQYNNEKGGIILASNFSSCLGWVGEFDGMPDVGGDCRAISLNDPFMLDSGKIYYGNNHFIHESIPVTEDVHRVFVRITMPEDHIFNKQVK